MESLTATDVLKALGILVLVANMAMNVFLFVKTRSNKRLDEMAESIASLGARLGAKIDGHEAHVRNEMAVNVARDAETAHRLSVLEVRVQHMPTHSDLQGIKSELSELRGSVSAIDERSENILGMVTTIQRHLMEK